jgi:hypothetical protein
MYQALLQMDGEPCTVQVGLLFICVDVVCAILSQGVELPRVVEYTVVPFLKVQELLQLAAEQTPQIGGVHRTQYKIHPTEHGDHQVGWRCRKPTMLQLRL